MKTSIFISFLFIILYSSIASGQVVAVKDSNTNRNIETLVIKEKSLIPMHQTAIPVSSNAEQLSSPENDVIIKNKIRKLGEVQTPGPLPIMSDTNTQTIIYNKLRPLNSVHK